VAVDACESNCSNFCFYLHSKMFVPPTRVLYPIVSGCVSLIPKWANLAAEMAGGEVHSRDGY